MSTPRDDDAQRDMEQRALRNVRALVDKYEDQDAKERHVTRRLLLTTVGITAGVCLVVFLLIYFVKPPAIPKSIDLPPPASAPR